MVRPRTNGTLGLTEPIGSEDIRPLAPDMWGRATAAWEQKRQKRSLSFGRGNSFMDRTMATNCGSQKVGFGLEDLSSFYLRKEVK